MCLTELDDKSEVSDEGVGYKVLSLSRPCVYRTLYWPEWVMSDVWNTRKQMRIVHTSWDNTPYESGFHLFVNEKDAIAYAYNYNGSIVKRVKYRGVLAYGLQMEAPTIVAKEIMIDD